MPLTIRGCRLDECARVLDVWRAAEAIPRLSAMVARDEPQTVAFWTAAPGWAREPRWQRFAKDL